MVTAVASAPPPDLSRVRDLWNCKSYGSKDCVFIPQLTHVTPLYHKLQPEAPAGFNIYPLIVGSSKCNCDSNTDSVEVDVGGQLSITDAWSQDISAPGISLGGEAGKLVLHTGTSGTGVWKISQNYYLAQVAKPTIPPKNEVSCPTLAIVNQISDT